MSFIKTYSGRRFDYLLPESNIYDFEEIAHALSLEQRFGNHLVRKWSVAQHVLLVHHLGRFDSCNETTLKWLVHHDDMEAYFKDIPTPLKNLIPDYKILYDKHEKHYQENVLKLDMSLLNMDKVKGCDYIALVYEDLLFGKECYIKFHDWTLDKLHSHYASYPIRYIQKLVLMDEISVMKKLLTLYEEYES